jgi:hypothetical protein
MTPDLKKVEIRPFSGKKIYFSNSIQGVLNQDPNLGWEIVNFLLENGANVLDKHVGGRTPEEKHGLFITDNGFDFNECDNPRSAVEQTDIKQVDEATHLVVFVDGPSHGVGNEIQRAIDRYEFKGENIQILCLVSEERADKLSWMISGKKSPKYPFFHLEVYKDVEEAKKHIFSFLASK